MATLPFLFYRGFTIYGGNIASTLAGEFAFSMSLSLALLYLGVVFGASDTGRHRALAAVLLALTGLCHLIPAFWALGGHGGHRGLVRFRRSGRCPPGSALDRRRVAVVAPSAWLMLGALASGGGPLLIAWSSERGRRSPALWLLSESVRWLAPTIVVGGLLSAWWVGRSTCARLPQRHGLGEAALRRPRESRFREWVAAPVPLRHARRRPPLGVRPGGWWAPVLSLALRLRVGIFL